MKYKIMTKNKVFRILYKSGFFSKWKCVTDGKFWPTPLEFNSFSEAVDGAVIERQKKKKSAQQWKKVKTDAI